MEYNKISENWEAGQRNTYRIFKYLKCVAQIVYWVMVFMKCGYTSKWKLIMYSSRDYRTIRHKRWRHHRAVSIPQLRWLILKHSLEFCVYKDPKCKVDEVDGAFKVSLKGIWSSPPLWNCLLCCFSTAVCQNSVF